VRTHADDTLLLPLLQQVNNTADNPEVVARHAAGLKQIAELEKELAALTEGIEAEAHRLSSIREPWLNKLQQMVSHIG
jgi:DNA repair ATPase RecN